MYQHKTPLHEQIHFLNLMVNALKTENTKLKSKLKKHEKRKTIKTV